MLTLPNWYGRPAPYKKVREGHEFAPQAEQMQLQSHDSRSKAAIFLKR